MAARGHNQERSMSEEQRINSDELENAAPEAEGTEAETETSDFSDQGDIIINS